MEKRNCRSSPGIGKKNAQELEGRRRLWNGPWNLKGRLWNLKGRNGQKG